MALTGQTMSLKLLRWCVIRLKLAFTIASKIRKHKYEQRAGQCKNHKIPDYTTHGPVSRVTCRHVTRVTRVSLWLLMCVWSDSARPAVTRDTWPRCWPRDTYLERAPPKCRTFICFRIFPPPYYLFMMERNIIWRNNGSRDAQLWFEIVEHFISTHIFKNV